MYIYIYRAAHGLAPCVAQLLAAMILALLIKSAHFFQEEAFQTPVQIQYR